MADAGLVLTTGEGEYLSAPIAFGDADSDGNDDLLIAGDVVAIGILGGG